jgi:hypothetical protein
MLDDMGVIICQCTKDERKDWLQEFSFNFAASPSTGNSLWKTADLTTMRLLLPSPPQLLKEQIRLR